MIKRDADTCGCDSSEVGGEVTGKWAKGQVEATKAVVTETLEDKV